MKHLRRRIFYKILIPTLLFYLVFSSIAFIIYKNSYKESAISAKEIELINITRVLGDWIATQISELIEISNSEELYNIDTRFQFLEKEQNRQKVIYTKLWFIDQDYRYRNTSNQHGEIFKENNFDRLFSKELLFSYIAPKEYWKYNSERSLFFSVPVNREDEVIGILSGSFPISELERVLHLYTYNIFEEYALIDVSNFTSRTRGGEIITSSRIELNGEDEADLYGKIYSSSSYELYENYFVSNLINNWKFIGKISSDSLFVQLKYFSRFFSFLTGVILLIISIIAVGISNSISYPVLELRKMVSRMLEGDFENEIKLNTQDELQELAEAFNLLNRRTIQLRTDDRFIFLGRISSRMAHEIRHPLHIIQIALQTVNSSNIQANREIIGKEIKKADMFIREVLEIAKPNELSMQNYSMNRLIESVLKSMTLLSNDKRVTFNYHNHAVTDQFYFDVLKIEQVITNILKNSFEAVEEEGSITISIKNVNNFLHVIISDDGPGFDETQINRVFDPYFTTKENGTGLGLSICYQIIAAHGAQIELSNNDTGGAETTIIFVI